jgi:methionyl-tRNA formyltransferase
MNGENETGITTFFLASNIDTGRVIFQERIPIGADENAGQLHDRMQIAGAELVLKTVRAIESSDIITVEQTELVKDQALLKTAPKIFPEDCRIDWTLTGIEIFNHIRGLSPYPAASAILFSLTGDEFPVKIFRSSYEQGEQNSGFPSIITDGKNYLKIWIRDGVIDILELQLAGKKKMDIQAFLRGFHIDNSWKIR